MISTQGKRKKQTSIAKKIIKETPHSKSGQAEG
jgi:hypothetical protein